MNTKKDLENLGFKGFIPVKELLLDISAIPNVNGVYACIFRSIPVHFPAVY